MAVYSPSDFRRALNRPHDAAMAGAFDLSLALEAGELREDPRFAGLTNASQQHDYGSQDFRRVLTAPHNAAMAGAYDLSHALDAGKLDGDPRFQKLTNLIGANSASHAVRTSGGAALSDSYAEHLPADIPIDETTRARGVAAVRQSLEQISTIKSPGERAAMADRIYGGMDRTAQARAGATTPDMSAVNSLVAQEMSKIAPEAMKHPATLANAGGGDGAGDFFRQNAFGQIGWDKKTGAVGGTYASNGGSSYGYSGMSSQWNPATGGAGLNSSNFSNTQFAHVGLDLGTTKSLFAKGFNQQQIIAAANDAKNLGFSPKDKAAVEDHAIIRKFDNKPDESNKALQAKNRLEDEHKEELKALLRKEAAAKTPEEKAAVRKEIAEHHKRLTHQAHVDDRMHDAGNKPQAKAAVGRRNHAIEVKKENELRRELGLTQHQRRATNQQHGKESHAKAKADTEVAKADAKANKFAALMAADQSQPSAGGAAPAPSHSSSEKPGAAPTTAPEQKAKNGDGTLHAGLAQKGPAPKLG